MSTVTNVILACSPEDWDRAWDALSDAVPHVVIMKPGASPSALSVCSNHLSGKHVRDVLAAVKWSEPAAVRLLIQEEKDAAFSVWVLQHEQHREKHGAWLCVCSDGCT